MPKKTNKKAAKTVEKAEEEAEKKIEAAEEEAAAKIKQAEATLKAAKKEAEAKKERARKLMSQRALLGKRLKKAVEKGAITESQLKEIESGKGSNVSMKG